MTEATIFAAALDRTDPKDRAAFLMEMCEADAPLRRRLEALLKAHVETDDLLDTPPGDSRTVECAPNFEQPGSMIGPYKLIERIGEGGFALVFAAEQLEPVQRMVALKVLKPGMDTLHIVARFEAERQTLAIMDHPNIAKVFDGGATTSGRPYFVMDLVKGVPITEYCEKNRLTLRQRLELFVAVCQAVQHAHQKGIIHRDLKPTNVLVSCNDGSPVVKVIDFGIAKVVGPTPTDKTLFTGAVQLMGTPLYMSPEQAGVSDLDIDTRSDIYSLGALLYELLTGATPYPKERFKQASYDEICRIIREENPPRPSARLSDAPAGTALAKQVRGELDWIAMKALEKDRRRRYESANDFAIDVQRYLSNERVLACPPTTLYRLNKFARRNRGLLSAAAAIVLLLTTAVVALSIMLVAVDRERQQKEAALEAEKKRRSQARSALDAMTSILFEDAISKQQALLPTHKQYLEKLLKDYEDFAADTGQDKESRLGVAYAYWRVGQIRQRLGQRTDAKNAWTKSLQHYSALNDEFPNYPDGQVGMASCYSHLSALATAENQAEEASVLLEKEMRIKQSLVAEYPSNDDFLNSLAMSFELQGNQLKIFGRPKDAREAYEEALKICVPISEKDPERVDVRMTLGRIYLSLGLLFEIQFKMDEAERSFAKAVDHQRQVVAQSPGNPYYRTALADAQNALGNRLRIAGRPGEAKVQLYESLANRRILVERYPAIPDFWRGLAQTLCNLGILLKDRNDHTEAEKIYHQTLAVFQQLAAEYPNDSDYKNELAGTMVNLARLHLIRNEPLAARKFLDDAVPHHKAALAANSDNPTYRKFFRINRWRMAEALLALKDHAGASAATREFLKVEYEPRDAYTAASLFASCIPLVEQDQGLEETKRKELAAAYGTSAVGALREAAAKGAKELNQLSKDPKLNPLRAREDFQKFSAEWEAKAKPVKP